MSFQKSPVANVFAFQVSSWKEAFVSQPSPMFFSIGGSRASLHGWMSSMVAGNLRTLSCQFASCFFLRDQYQDDQFHHEGLERLEFDPYSFFVRVLYHFEKPCKKFERYIQGLMNFPFFLGGCVFFFEGAAPLNFQFVSSISVGALISLLTEITFSMDRYYGSGWRTLSAILK